MIRLTQGICVTAALALTTLTSTAYADGRNWNDGPVVSDRGSFVSRAQLRNWFADRERGLWIQGGNSEWFYARFSAACHGLNSTNSLVFDTGSSGNIDRTTSVVLPGGGRCEMQTFAPSAGPPKDRNADVVPQPQTQ